MARLGATAASHLANRPHILQRSFDKERYEGIREIAAEIMAHGAGLTDASVITDLFKGDVGYATPKVDVRAAVFDQGRILRAVATMSL